MKEKENKCEFCGKIIEVNKICDCTALGVTDDGFIQTPPSIPKNDNEKQDKNIQFNNRETDIGNNTLNENDETMTQSYSQERNKAIADNQVYKNELKRGQSHQKNNEKRFLSFFKKKKNLIFLAISFVVLVAAVLCLSFISLEAFRKDRLAFSGQSASVVVIIYIVAMLCLISYFFSDSIKEAYGKIFTTKKITRTAIFSALAVVLYYYLKFPIPALFPSFLDIQISDLPALLAGFMLGPIHGCIVILIKCLVKLPNSSTFFIGEMVDLILGIAFVLTTSFIYRRKKTLKGAIISLVIGSLVCTFFAALANRFIAVPAYIELMFGGSWTPLLGMMNKIFNGKVTENNFYYYYIFLSIIPFNLLRCIITSILTFLLYKSLKKVFERLSI